MVRDQQGQLSLTCPNCRQATPIPANGVTGLQSAFQVNDFLEIMKEHQKSKDAPTSEEGVKGDTASPTSSKKVSPYCSVHADKELELYCETCWELICSHCALRGQEHHTHEYNLISSCYEKFKREVISSLEPVEKTLKTVETALIKI